MSDTRVVDVVDSQGKKTGQAELPSEMFDVQTNVPLIHQVVTAQLAAARQGTHATKTRAMVRGGGKKPWRQKGTGRARHGSTRSPIWVGGGVSKRIACHKLQRCAAVDRNRATKSVRAERAYAVCARGL